MVSESESNRDEDVIHVLESGADDLLPRNTSAPLLLARIRVGLRARPVAARVAEQFEVGDVVVDLSAHAAYVGGAAVKCPPRQFLLLAALARQPNAVIDHETLINDVWGDQPGAVDPRRLRIAVSLLRGVLGSGTDRPRIETVPHIGYRLATRSRPQPAA